MSSVKFKNFTNANIKTSMSMTKFQKFPKSISVYSKLMSNDFSCMVEIEVDNVYNKMLRRNIMKTQKVDK